MKILVWEGKDNATGHGGAMRTTILNLCPHLTSTDVIVGYEGTTDPLFPSWCVSITDAGYYSVPVYAAANGFSIVNKSYTSAVNSRYSDFETAGIPLVHACTSEVGDSPGWACFVGRDYTDMSKTSVHSNALDFKLQHDGTLSAATATITGHIANLLNNHPAWNFADARQALRQTASDYATTGWTNARGYGYINYAAANALTADDLLIATPGDIRATVDPVTPSVAVAWSNLPTTKFVSTKLVRFASEPTPSTPIGDGTTLYDGANKTYTWNSGSAIPPSVGTHYLAVYSVDSLSNTSRLETCTPLTVIIAAQNTWYVDNTSLAGLRNGLAWASAFVTFAQAYSAATAGDTVYVRATDVPHTSIHGNKVMHIYGDATGDGTTRGTKRSVCIASSGLVPIGVLLPGTPYNTLRWFVTGGTATIIGLYGPDKKFIRLLDNAATVADCIANPGSWIYDSADTRKNFINTAGLPFDHYVITCNASYTRHYGGTMAGIDFQFCAPGSDWMFLGAASEISDCSISYTNNGGYLASSSSAFGITWRRVAARYNIARGYQISSKASVSSARIRMEYCLAEHNDLTGKIADANRSGNGFDIIHAETATYAHQGVLLYNCTARNNYGSGFIETGNNGKITVSNCYGHGNRVADFNKVTGTAVLICSYNLAGGANPYAGDWESSKGTGSAENNAVRLAAAAVAGMHDQATPAKDVNGKTVYTVPDIGAVQFSGPLYFNSAAADGGNGSRTAPYNAWTDYDFSGYKFRAGGEIVVAGSMGAADLTTRTDTGAITIKPWPGKSGILAVGGMTVAADDVFEFSAGGAAAGVRGVFQTIWE